MNTNPSRLSRLSDYLPNRTAEAQPADHQAATRDSRALAFVQSVRNPATVTTATAPVVPEWIETCIAFLQAKFAVGADSAAWDSHDTRDYGKQLARLQPRQGGEVMRLLRERHTFRPSVAEVKAVVDEVSKPAELLPAYVSDARRLVSTPPLPTEPTPGQSLLSGKTREETVKDLIARARAAKEQLVADRGLTLPKITYEALQADSIRRGLKSASDVLTVSVDAETAARAEAVMARIREELASGESPQVGISETVITKKGAE